MNGSRRPLLLACLQALLLVLSTSCSSRTASGLDQIGLPVYLLESDGARIDDEARADAVVQASEARLGVALPGLLETASRSAAVAEHVPVDRVAVSADGNPPDGEIVMLGSSTAFTNVDVRDELPSGIDFEAVASVRVRPWPRREGVLPHPELLMVQSSVVYLADGEAFRLGRVLAEELADLARGVVVEEAERLGLTGSLDVPAER